MVTKKLDIKVKHKSESSHVPVLARRDHRDCHCRMRILAFTNRMTMMADKAVSLIQTTDNQGDIIVQEPLAQLGEISEILSAIYQSYIEKIVEIFMLPAIVRTNWAGYVILLNSKLPLGERYWYITQAVANGWSSNVLQMQIDTNLFARQIKTKKVSNFSALLNLEHDTRNKLNNARNSCH